MLVWALLFAPTPLIFKDLSTIFDAILAVTFQSRYATSL